MSRGNGRIWLVSGGGAARKRVNPEFERGAIRRFTEMSRAGLCEAQNEYSVPGSATTIGESEIAEKSLRISFRSVALR